MSNMSYCKFENTLEDLRDCYQSLEQFDYGELSESEAEAAARLINLCRQIADNYEGEDIEGILKQYTEK